MSELAFNLNGERFEVPAVAALWRVRRLRDVPRGGPEVVYGKDGTPLIIPIDCDMEAFRRYVDDVAGRYRLDPIDERHRPVEGCPAAYLQLSKQERNGLAHAATAPGSGGGGDDRDSIVREVVRANSEMVKTIAEKFAGVMEAAASLLRAADGAGLPARQPPPPLEDDDDDDDEEEEEVPARASELKPLWDMLGVYMATKMGVPVGQAGVKPAGGAGPVPSTGAATPGGPARNTGASKNANAPTATEPPQITPAMMAHFAAIQQRLTPEEAQLAREAAKELSPTEIRSWMHQLSQLGVDDAVTLIRKTIGGQGKSEPAPAATSAAGGAA